jgi:hypothetical protein
MTSAAIIGRIAPIANKLQVSSPTSASKRRAGASPLAAKTRQEPNVPMPTIASPMMAPTITTNGLPKPQFWNDESDPTWCAMKKPIVPSAMPDHGAKLSRMRAQFTAAEPSKS